MNDVVYRFGRVLVCAVLVLCQFNCASADGAERSVTEAMMEDKTPSVVRVTGSHTVRERPDQAWVTVGVQAVGDSAGEAQGGVSRVMASVIEAVRATDAKVEQIQTSSISLSPRYDNNRNRAPGEPPRIVGYAASNTVTVRIGAIDRVGSVIDAAAKGGANSIGGVRFGLSDERIAEARLKGLRIAVREAKAKAVAMADALDLSLGRVLEMIEQGAQDPGPRWASARGAEMMMADATPVEPGEVEAAVQVTLVFELAEQDHK